MDTWTNILINATGAVVVSIGSLKFIKEITQSHAISMEQKDKLFVRSISDLAKAINKQREAIQDQKESSRELKIVIEQMYKELLKRSRALKEYEQKAN